MKKLTLVLFMFLLVLACSRPVLAEEAGKKVYVVFSTASDSSWWVLQNVEITDFNGVKCLKGKQIDMTWAANKIIYVPVEALSTIVEFDSLDQYKKEYDDSVKKAAKPKK